MQKRKSYFISLIILLIGTFCCVSFFSANYVVYAEDTDVEEPIEITYDEWDGTSEAFSLLNSQNENSEDNPYIINTAKKLAYLAESVNGGESYSGKYFKLTVNINLKGIVNEEYDIYGGNFWTPIGYKNTSEENAFSGYFDGGNKRIINLVYKTGTIYENCYGLFGYTSSATIKDINVSCKLKISGDNVSGLVGYSKNTNISGCVIDTSIAGSVNNVAGLVGYLENSENIAIDRNNVVIFLQNTGTSNSAGLIGGVSNSQNSLTISNSRVNTNLNVTSNVGGISNVVLSTGSTTISNCIVDGTIEGNSASNVAGILGVNEGALVSGCKSTAEITSTGDYVAGIVAINSGKLYNCVSTNIITGGNYTAGIVAKTTNEVNNCVNNAQVVGKNYTAGVVAWALKDSNDYVIKCSYNNGLVTGEDYVAGIVANLNSATLKYCFNSVLNPNDDGYGIVGEDYVAGVVASASLCNINTIYNTSNVYSQGLAGGLIVNYIGNNTKNTLQEFLIIGKVKGTSVAGVVNTASSINFAYGYTLPTLEFVGEENYNISGAITGNFASCAFENVYFCTDFCEVAHGITSNDNDEIIATTSKEIKQGQLSTLILSDQETMAFYYLEESEIDKDTLKYYAYYPVLRNLFLDVYSSDCDNYFEDSSAVQNAYDSTMICDTFDAVTIKFKTNCNVEIEDIVVKQNQDLTEIIENLPEIKKDGYVFEGWFTDAKFKNELNLEDKFTSDVTLYAKFDAPFISLPWWVFVIIGVVIIIVLATTFVVTNKKRTISFKLNDENIEPIQLKVGDKIKLPNPTKVGFTFSGWYYTETFTKKFELNTMPNIDLVLYGKFESVTKEKKEVKERVNKAKDTSKTTSTNKKTSNKGSNKKVAVNSKKQ